MTAPPRVTVTHTGTPSPEPPEPDEAPMLDLDALMKVVERIEAEWAAEDKEEAA
jgi:hypothetical protein